MTHQERCAQFAAEVTTLTTLATAYGGIPTGGWGVNEEGARYRMQTQKDKVLTLFNALSVEREALERDAARWRALAKLAYLVVVDEDGALLLVACLGEDAYEDDATGPLTLAHKKFPYLTLRQRELLAGERSGLGELPVSGPALIDAAMDHCIKTSSAEAP